MDSNPLGNSIALIVLRGLFVRVNVSPSTSKRPLVKNRHKLSNGASWASHFWSQRGLRRHRSPQSCLMGPDPNSLQGTLGNLVLRQATHSKRTHWMQCSCWLAPGQSPPGLPPGAVASPSWTAPNSGRHRGTVRSRHHPWWNLSHFCLFLKKQNNWLEWCILFHFVFLI